MRDFGRNISRHVSTNCGLTGIERNPAMSDVALLAPVPLVHLSDGVGVCRKRGKVAFGSRAWEVFNEIKEIRQGKPIDVLIYASLANTDGPATVTWKAQYIDFVEGKNGAHPQGMMFRPSSTDEHSSDNFGHWAVFWEVQDLQKLPDSQQLPVTAIQSLSGKYYKSSFVPEGPILVQNPWRTAS
jgi:hypothetical protein